MDVNNVTNVDPLLPVESLSSDDSDSGTNLTLNGPARLQNTDRFVRSGGAPLIDDLPSGSVAGGVRSILAFVNSIFGASSGNSTPMFRIALVGWAFGILASVLAQLDNALLSVKKMDSPLKRELTGLQAIVKSLVSLLAGFREEHRTKLISYKELRKSFNDLSKGSF